MSFRLVGSENVKKPKHTDKEYDALFQESEEISTKLAYSIHIDDYKKLEAERDELKAKLAYGIEEIQRLNAEIERLKMENEQMKRDFDSIDWDYERTELDIHPDPDSTLKEAKR